jgi:hypothetical protein
VSKPDLGYCERCNGPCIASDAEPSRSVEIARRAKILKAWPAVLELLDYIEQDHAGFTVCDMAKRVREAIK